MAYRDFSLEDLELTFGIQNKIEHLFDEEIPPLPPGSFLLEAHQLAKELPVRSEKAKSELIVMPILLELRKHNNKYITIYSGETLQADRERGLTGECDFVIAKDTGTFSINVPIMILVEAKKHDLEIGIAQCAAQLVGAQRFNQQRNTSLSSIFGCVTNGDKWHFLRLKEQRLSIDANSHYLRDLAQILGIFQHIIQLSKKELEMAHA